MNSTTKKGIKRHSAFPSVDELLQSLEEIEITKRRRLSTDPIHKITSQETSSENSNDDGSNCMNVDQERDWSSLTPDLLIEILRLFGSMRDFMAFREVCRSWRRVAAPTRYALARQPPLFLCTGFQVSSEGFIDMNCLRLHILKLRQPHRVPCTLGYSHGFLISTIGLDYFDQTILLRNLFTGAEFLLPKTTEAFQRVRLSASPLSSECLVILFAPGDSIVQFCWSGQSHWRIGCIGPDEVLDDMLFLNGKLYALTNGKKLLSVDPFSWKVAVLGVDDEISREESTNSVSKWVLAECNGQLLLIGYLSLGGLRLYKWDNKSSKWASTSSLDGCAMFLSFGGFAGSIVPSGSRIRANCIYYFDHDRDGFYEYSLDDKILRYPFRYYGLQKGCMPVWVLPSLC
ncbi:hypothetical protein LUZ62_057862 [Rhynchospora pubera]|uniref:KIB1-4 beta-propeller domain-containing protein n=1 Tax=Rhynchospora pubera TaxID=906938 RepID=A0AAV8E0B2_9POAL|nr:hypothetical protein LUZ62_057862 [Rhynchospora pubera]